jgi:hypothetical protein
MQQNQRDAAVVDSVSGIATAVYGTYFILSFI